MEERERQFRNQRPRSGRIAIVAGAADISVGLGSDRQVVSCDRRNTIAKQTAPAIRKAYGKPASRSGLPRPSDSSALPHTMPMIDSTNPARQTHRSTVATGKIDLSISV
jgi:hypothetical protein